MTQCSSCGGFCGRVCQRDNTKALELACYYHNRCCDLEEIIELFCMDAEVNQFWPDWDITKVLHERIAELEQELQTTADALGHALLESQT